MGYCEVWQPYREAVKERYPLVLERLEQIETEETVKQPYLDYFRRTLPRNRGKTSKSPAVLPFPPAVLPAQKGCKFPPEAH